MRICRRRPLRPSGWASSPQPVRVLASATRRYRDDALSITGSLLLLSVLGAGPVSRDAAGLFVVAFIALRFAAPIYALVRAERSCWLLLAPAFGVYAGLAAWSAIAVAAHGDQVH